MAGFYSARVSNAPPLHWPGLSPPCTPASAGSKPPETTTWAGSNQRQGMRRLDSCCCLTFMFGLSASGFPTDATAVSTATPHRARVGGIGKSCCRSSGHRIQGVSTANAYPVTGKGRKPLCRDTGSGNVLGNYPVDVARAIP